MGCLQLYFRTEIVSLIYFDPFSCIPQFKSINLEFFSIGNDKSEDHSQIFPATVFAVGIIEQDGNRISTPLFVHKFFEDFDDDDGKGVRQIFESSDYILRPISIKAC